MAFVLDEGVAVLARTPAALSALLSGLPEGWTEATEGGDTWCPHEVVGHLIHGEDTDWIPRARLILEHGEGRPFDPYDRLAQRARFAGAPLADLLALFARRRAENLEVLAGLRLTPADLARAGAHPALGRVTLGQLLATWVAHDLDHLVQVARIMARRYTDEVGPWKEYLRVVRDV